MYQFISHINLDGM